MTPWCAQLLIPDWCHSSGEQFILSEVAFCCSSFFFAFRKSYNFFFCEKGRNIFFSLTEALSHKVNQDHLEEWGFTTSYYIAWARNINKNSYKVKSPARSSDPQARAVVFIRRNSVYAAKKGLNKSLPSHHGIGCVSREGFDPVTVCCAFKPTCFG